MLLWRSALLAIRYTFACKYTYLGAISDPCCIREPIVNHNELFKENLFSKTSGASELQGCGFSHSYGLNLNIKHAHTTQACNINYIYLNKLIRPYVIRITWLYRQCSGVFRKCSGGGDCSGPQKGKIWPHFFFFY